MYCVVFMSAGIPADFRMFAISYSLLRMLLVIKYVRVAIHIHKVRKLTAGFCIGFGIGSILWFIGGICNLLSLCIVGIIVEYMTPFLLVPLMISVHKSHMVERFSSFAAITCAGNIFMILKNMQFHIGIPLSFIGESQDNFSSMMIPFLAICIPISTLIIYSTNMGVETSNFHESN